MSTPALANFGSPLLKEKFLSPSIKGEMVACIGVSEQGGGSDVANIVTTAKKKNGYYYITGNVIRLHNRQCHRLHNVIRLNVNSDDQYRIRAEYTNKLELRIRSMNDITVSPLHNLSS